MFTSCSPKHGEKVLKKTEAKEKDQRKRCFVALLLHDFMWCILIIICKRKTHIIHVYFTKVWFLNFGVNFPYINLMSLKWPSTPGGKVCFERGRARTDIRTSRTKLMTTNASRGLLCLTKTMFCFMVLIVQLEQNQASFWTLQTYETIGWVILFRSNIK